MNHQESSVRSYLKTDFNRSLMNRSLFATSLKNWFVTGLATFVLVLASGLDAFAQTVSLTYTGVTTFTVPAGVTSVTVKAKGAAGGFGGLDGPNSTGPSPGSLGFVNAVYSVNPGDVIGIYPGNKGNNGGTGSNCCGGAGGSSTFGNYGGGNGGSASFSGTSGGGGGGGAATVVTRNSSVIAVAAGGPGGGGHGNCLNSGYAGATWIAAGSTTNGTDGSYGNTCGSNDGGGGGGGGGGANGGLGGWTHVTSCGGECAGDGGYIGNNGVYGAASITSNTIIGNTNSNGDVVIEYTAVVGTASSAQTICAGNAPAALSLSGSSGNIQWQVSTDNANFSNISGATSATLSSLQMGVLTATRYYRAVVSGVAISNTVVITVNPSPVINSNTSAVSICAGSSTTLIASGASSYSWSPSTGLNTTSGSTVIASPTATTTYTITDPTDLCEIPRNITVTVNPLPSITNLSSSVVLSGTPMASQPFTSTIAGSTFAWTNNTTSIGLAASGTGSVPAFTALNNTSAPITATISVIPTAPTSCAGAAQTYTVKVDPIPNVNTPSNVTNCEGTLTAVDFNGTTANTNYLWTNTNTAIGLAASGANDLSFTSQNTTNVAQTATVVVTPQSYVTQGYVWGSVNENSALVLTAPAGKIFTSVEFASYGTPSAPVNGNYTLGACHATTSSSVIEGLAIGNNTMTVVANNATFGDPCVTSGKLLAVKLGFGISATGTAKTFTITVNPSATIANTSDTICTGTAFTLATNVSDIVPANTSYSWTVVNNANITGETSQATTSSAVSQTLFNSTSLDQIATYTITPSSGAAACVGSPFTYNVTVTPLPTTITAGGATTFCDGGSVNLSAPVAPLQMSYTYQWNLNGAPITGATSISYIANASGSYTVTVTNNAGCSAISQAVVVTENPLPTVAAITGTTSVCTGSTTTLSSLTAGGSWTTSNTATATVNALSGVVTGVSAGVATITYTVTNVNGCVNSQTASVTVNPLPTVAALTGASTICVGSTTTFESATTGGVWSSSSAAVASVSTSGVVTGVSAGQATITYTVTSGAGCVSSVSADINVNAVPTPTITASGATTFCTSGTVTLTASAGSSYLWSNGAQTQAITVSSTGSYTVAVTNAAGCSATSAATAVTMNALPTVAAITGATNVCIGSTTTFESATTSGVWSSSSAAVASVSTSGVVTGVSAGQATITYTVTSGAGCVSSVSADINVNAVPTPTITASGATTFCSGGSVTLTSSAGSSYLWSNGAQTQAITVSSTGSYTVAVTNAAGCSATSAATAVTMNALPTANIIAGGPLTFCQGGSVTLNASPVVTGNTYLWSTGATTASITATTSSTITLTITSAAGCATTSLPTAVVVNANPTATITASGATTFCQGGSVTLTASAGSGHSYQWSNNTNDQILVVNTSGSYTVTVTNAAGCSTTSSATTVTVNALPTTAAITGTSAVCIGGTTLLSTTATSPVWSSANTTIATVAANGLVTGVSAGTTQVSYTITNANGCTNTASVTVTVNQLPTAAIATVGATTFCQGGSVTLLASNAPAGMTYTYQWRLNGTAITGATANSFVANASGSYSVTITTNSGCSATSAATVVTVNALPILAANTGAVAVCENATTTIANAQVGGLWSTANNTVATINAITGQVTGVNPGTTALTYTFTNANGCTNTSVTNFTVNALPSAIISASGATTFCQGGSVILTASTGTSYLWSTGATTASITVNNTQDVSVTVTNANGCSATSAIMSVVVNALPVANITSLNGNAFCQGGSVTLVASNGSAYVWSNGANTQSTTVSTTQTLTVTVTNANGCSSTSAPFTVTMNAAPTTTITANGPTTFCAGGSVTLTAPTAAAYLWSSGETTQSIVASVDGPYTVTVTNGNGCIATSANTNITVLSLPSVQASAGSNNVCVGSTVTLSNATIGGVWSSSNAAVATVAANGTVTGVSAGLVTLTYTVTNANGCSNAVGFNMTVNANPTLTAISGTAAVCAGSTTTLANSQFGGTWSSSDVAVATIAANGVVNGLTAGTATITYTYTNASGCTSNASTALVVNALPVATVALSGPTTFCAGGSVTLTAPIGMNYAWSTGESTQSITVSTSGNYTVAITNANGCTATSAPVNVTVNALPTVSIAAIGATTFCAGGSVTLISPLNSTYAYTWNLGTTQITGASNNTLVASATGAYSLTITDVNGCTATSAAIPVTVNALPVVVATAGGPTTFCAGGSVTSTATGATSYVWSNGSTAPSITVSSSGTYSVVGTTNEGCASTSNVISVVVNALPTPSISSTGSTACLGTTINLTANGGATYSWSNGSTNASIAVTAANVYTVTATSAEGCIATVSETVVFNANPSVTISANGPTVFCQGGSLTLTATGGSNYVWSNGTLGATATVNQSGSYYVMVTNASGCTTQSALVNVTVNSVPVVAAITGANAVCEGGNILLSSATIGGTWSVANNFIANIDGAGNVTGLNAGTTTVSYTVSTNGCTATTTAQLNVLNNPVTPTITASGATSVCPGSTVVLFASNGANYQWNTGATTPFVVASQSGTYTVTVTGINGCSATSLPMSVFIGDNTNPVITAPLNVTVTPNLGCEAIGVTLGSPTTSDNCGVATVSNDAPAIYPIGTTTVTWTVTDASGNVASATQLVTVVDQTAPSAFAPANVTVASNSNCEATDVELGLPNATDNCTNNLVVSNNAPTTYPLGSTIVTWTITDAAGNTTTVDQTVTVVDQTAPVVLLANTSLILDANGDATINFAALDNGSYDNCGIASTELSQSTFDCSQVGKNFITVYVTDNSGNQSSAVVMVTVVASDACGGDNWDGPSVPDAFTPNGNNYNDTWVIPGLEGYNTKELTVYSRYGTVVHYSTVYSNDWDGTLLNTGTPVPDGTYYYILNLDGGKQLNGYVYINRVKQ
jgi:gliding motility-associated-like protein